MELAPNNKGGVDLRLCHEGWTDKITCSKHGTMASRKSWPQVTRASGNNCWLILIIVNIFGY